MKRLQETYDHLLELPMVKRLRLKNRLLRKENKKLVGILLSKFDQDNVQYKLFEVEEEEVEEEEVEEEEVEEEEVEEEEVEEEEVEEEEVEEEEVEEEVEEELEVSEVLIGGKTFYSSDSGDIYGMDADGDVGDKVGQFVDGKAVFHE